MEKIMENSSDLHVVAKKVYAKPSCTKYSPCTKTSINGSQIRNRSSIREL